MSFEKQIRNFNLTPRILKIASIGSIPSRYTNVMNYIVWWDSLVLCFFHSLACFVVWLHWLPCGVILLCWHTAILSGWTRIKSAVPRVLVTSIKQLWQFGNHVPSTCHSRRAYWSLMGFQTTVSEAWSMVTLAVWALVGKRGFNSKCSSSHHLSFYLSL